MKVLALVITGSQVKPEVIEQIKAQTFSDFQLVVSYKKGEVFHSDLNVNKYMNVTAHRNFARKLALSTDATHILLVDDDVVIPFNAISDLMRADKDIVGGWYLARGGKFFVAGNFEDEKLVNFKVPVSGLTPVTMPGLGCVLIKRPVLEKVEFKVGANRVIKNDSGENILAGDCLTFGLDAKKLGFETYMSGDVICTHIV